MQCEEGNSGIFITANELTILSERVDDGDPLDFAAVAHVLGIEVAASESAGGGGDTVKRRLVQRVRVSCCESDAHAMIALMKTEGRERVERRLAAILAVDVAGCSRLMGADEEGTLAALRAIRLPRLATSD